MMTKPPQSGRKAKKSLCQSHTQSGQKSRTINEWIDHTGHMVARMEHGQLSVMYQTY